MIEVMEKAQTLIGKKLEGKVIELNFDSKLSDKQYKMTSQKIEPEEMKKIKEMLNYSRVRFIYKGGIYTQEIRTDRINIHINDDFVIDRVYIG